MQYFIVTLVAGILGLAAAQTAPPASNVTTVCTGLPPYSNVRDVSDCSKFFRCTDSGPTLSTCALGYFFNSTLNACARPPVDCFACPKEPYFIDLPVDYECLQFIRCFAGNATQHTCSDGLLFDPNLKQCNLRREVDCACPTVDIPNRPLFVRDWKNCNKYHVCANGKQLKGECPKDLVFNLANQQCDHKDHVDCNDNKNTNGY